MTPDERDINGKRSILECPHPPNKDGFCTIPQECIAKRMVDQEDCDLVCKAMQELRVSNTEKREKALDKLEKLYPENTWITPNGDLVGGWELNPKCLRRLKKLIEKTPSFECEPSMKDIEIVILAIKRELREQSGDPR